MTEILQNYVALALVVIKSKPTGITIEEFVLALKHSLLHPSSVNTEARDKFDLAKLWHALFRALHKSRGDFPIRLDAPRNGLGPEGNIGRANLTLDSRKRKPPTRDTIETPSKRQKFDYVSFLDFEPEDVSEDLPQQHRDRSLLLRIVSGLARQPQCKPPHPAGLTNLVRLACDSILEVLRVSDDRTTEKQSLSSARLMLTELCVVTKKIWSLILIQLKRYRDLQFSELDIHMVIPQSCLVVHEMLNRLHLYCSTEATRRHDVSHEREPDKQNSGSRLHLPNDEQKRKLFDHNSNALTSTLAYILASTIQLHSVQSALSEAIITVFLDHLGASMSLWLFADPESDSLSAGLASTRGLNFRSSSSPSAALRIAIIEAPFLVSVLRDLMGAVRHSVDSVCFSIPPVQHLQKILVRGIFADLAQSPTNDSYDIALDRCSINVAHVYNEEEKEHYIEEVWNLLGWDILLAEDEGLRTDPNDLLTSILNAPF